MKKINEVVSRDLPLKHYQWGSQCDSWNLVDEKLLSVKIEKMPPLSQEQSHFHEKAQQFFFILKGKAVFEIDGIMRTVNENQGIHIMPGQKHKVMNNGNMELEFILSSQPSTLNDRINCE